MRIGILGGGQLARMLALAGAPLGLRFLVVDGSADACAGQVAPLHVCDYGDFDRLAEFAAQVDVVTFDFENVPAVTAEWLAARVPVFPNPRALAVAQDRVSEKTLFNALGIATPRYAAVDTRADLDAALATVGAPAILKTRRLGYDGKGQFRLRSAADADAAWAALGGVPLVLEAFVPFDREVSVIAVRGRGGEFRAYPLTRNWHADGILSASVAPAGESADLTATAAAHARAVADELDYVGTFALELFVQDGKLLANEMAPRVHNSGHWTIEGATVSQFENHLRAVAGLPLGAVDARGVAVMLNFVGTLPDARPVLASPNGHWHDYGKSARAGRKVGHATWVTADAAGMVRELTEAGAGLRRDGQVEGVVDALSRMR
jgi:5-(carboxyamino)imidazole ribonucleotide synthase